MIDESTLTRALDEAASAYDEPAGARETILSAAAYGGREPTERPSRLRAGWRRPALAAAVVAVLLTAGGVALTAWSGDDAPTDLELTAGDRFSKSSGETLNENAGKSGAGTVDFGGPQANVPRPPRPNPAPLAASDGQPAGSGTGTSGSVAAGAPAPPAPAAPQAGNLAKVVKTGAIEIAVPDGKVPATLARLETLVAGSRGFVADSKTQETGDSPSGVVTMRVPGTAYEAMLGRVRGLGEVRTVTSSGEDVTAAFVDTEARLKTLRDTKAVYDTLLAKARSIGEVLAVQQQINGAQTQIEQLEGKLKVLKDQVAYATLTVSVFEESDELATLEEPGRISSAWDRAKDNFGDGVEWVIAASGTVALLLLAGAVLLIGGLSARRLLRRRLI